MSDADEPMNEDESYYSDPYESGSGFEDYEEEDDVLLLGSDSDSPQDQHGDGDKDAMMEERYAEEFAEFKRDDVSNSVSAYKRPFTCLSIQDLETRQGQLIDQVVSLTGLASYKAAVLLRRFRWHDDSLIERLMDDSRAVCEKHGVWYSEPDHDGSTPCFVKAACQDFMCAICCDTPKDRPEMKVAGMPCGHKFCDSCYSRYISMKINEEGESASMACPGVGCNLTVVEPLVIQLSDQPTIEKYHEQLTRDYVASNDLFKWCPAPNCTYAIECDWKGLDLEACAPVVVCNCGKEFCIVCSSDNHQPCTCLMARLWHNKCRDDSETANWMALNTKDCPKCFSSIEKNGGCNHMTCKKCRNEFCWLCMGTWANHGNSYYNCSRYKERKDDKDTTVKAEARKSLERYLHYYNRYVNHTESLKLDRQTFLAVQDKMSAMQQEAGMSWIEVQFLNQAYEVLRAARQTLAWSYAFVYLLKSNNLVTLFEDMQQDLEFNVENLSALFEKPAVVVAKSKIELQDRRSYVENRRLILLNTAIKGIIDQTWEYMDYVKDNQAKWKVERA